MNRTDYDEFSQMLDAVCGLLSRGNYTPSATNTALWFRSLAEHELSVVRAAFDAHVKDPQRGRFVPTPADIISQIDGLVADDGRPGVEESWAAVLRSRDEAQTIVWTDEMACAWADARVVLDGGDEVGARMAFKEIYGRLVDEARRARRAAVWSASLGFDASLREQAITQAAMAGRLPAPDVLRLSSPAVSLDALTGAAPPEVREKLIALRKAMAERADAPSAAEMDRIRTQALKDDAAAKLAGFGLGDA